MKNNKTAQQKAEETYNKRNKEERGIVRVGIRIKEKDVKKFYFLAKASRDGRL